MIKKEQRKQSLFYAFDVIFSSFVFVLFIAIVMVVVVWIGFLFVGVGISNFSFYACFLSPRASSSSSSFDSSNVIYIKVH